MIINEKEAGVGPLKKTLQALNNEPAHLLVARWHWLKVTLV